MNLLVGGVHIIRMITYSSVARQIEYCNGTHVCIVRIVIGGRMCGCCGWGDNI